MFKVKIIKHISRIMVILILLSGALTLSGCEISEFYSDWYTNGSYIDRYEYKYYLTQERKTNHIKILKMLAVSDVTEFETENISFTLMYGTHANVYYGRKNAHYYDKNDYRLSSACLGEYKFAIYVCEGQNELMLDCNDSSISVEDIENIDAHTHIKTISEDEAFSDEYGYASLAQIFTTRERFRHTEKIHIPEEYCNKSSGSFAVKIVAFIVDASNNTLLVDTAERIIFNYQKNDNQIIIDFYEV